MFFWVVALGVIPCPLAWTSPDVKPSVEWNFTLPGKDTSESSRLDDVLASARAARRPVMIDFSAEWCAACRLLDRNAFTAPDVIRQASRFVTIRIDVSNIDDATDLLV
ncbi:MAG TPA: thioredoxin family protein, partial [Candidatus Polarisedimenticolia bacterium]|nr:thioredoxin family protein [Candidatus Polarisedimenticolia bacterium]